MATTACFAGPIFNLCAGLGLGFWALMKSTGREEIHVELPRNIATGFVFAIANCLLIIIANSHWEGCDWKRVWICCLRDVHCVCSDFSLHITENG